MSVISLKAGACGRVFDTSKMYVYLREALDGAGMEESVRALTYMRKHHEWQFRNDVQAILLGVKLTDPEFVNSPHAKDYAFLVTGEACPW